MTRPHQRFGFKEPLTRQIPRGTMGWSLIVAAAWIGFAVLYVAQVTQAVPRGDRLQQMQKKVSSLQKDVNTIQEDVSKTSSIQELSNRAQALGLVQVQTTNYINPAASSFARR